LQLFTIRKTLQLFHKLFSLADSSLSRKLNARAMEDVLLAAQVNYFFNTEPKKLLVH
jgi:hypothetical protein